MVIIPARLASNRFPNKVLTSINGLPMVIATAKRVQNLDEVVIATDSNEVVEVAKRYNFRAVMTSKNHNSGTDRVNEAVDNLNLPPDEIIINLQADEPFIEVEVVKALIDRVKSVKERDIIMVSCYKKIDNSFANDPNHVKVVIDKFENAIYFSRSKIPYDREKHSNYFGHIGIYGFRKENLNLFCNLPPAPIEDIEKLEQLRAIYNGKKISMVRVESRSFGIDTEEDLKLALELLK